MHIVTMYVSVGNEEHATAAETEFTGELATNWIGVKGPSPWSD